MDGGSGEIAGANFCKAGVKFFCSRHTGLDPVSSVFFIFIIIQVMFSPFGDTLSFKRKGGKKLLTHFRVRYATPFNLF